MEVDIILYAIIAAGLVFWLRSIIGTRHGDERERPNPFAPQPGKLQNLEPVPGSRQMAPLPATPAEDRDEFDRGLERNMSIAPQAREGLGAVAGADPGFKAASFLRGAQDAFVMIVEAFAAGERETLKNLLTESLYAAFCAALDERVIRGEKTSVEIHAVRRAEILSAWVKEHTAFITVRFTADETSVTRGPADALLSGDPDRVTETIDIWTFGRDVRSKEPVWLLLETRDENAADSDRKTVPDS